MAASNSKDCFKEVIGRTVIGVLFDALPVGRHDLSEGNKTLVFEDGSGLTISSNGSFWREPANEVRRAIDIRGRELAATKECIEAVLSLAGKVR